jgi:hypothetical protein
MKTVYDRTGSDSALILSSFYVAGRNLPILASKNWLRLEPNKSQNRGFLCLFLFSIFLLRGPHSLYLSYLPSSLLGSGLLSPTYLCNDFSLIFNSIPPLYQRIGSKNISVYLFIYLTSLLIFDFFILQSISLRM